MLKKFTFLLAITFVATQLFSQPWTKTPYLQTKKDTVSFYDLKDAFYRYWNGKKIQRGCGYNQFKRWEYQMETASFPDGKIPSKLQYYNEYKKFLNQTNLSGQKSNFNWIPLGIESWVNGIAGYNPGNGRLNAVTVNMAHRNIIYVASPSGGIWKSIDEGATWNTTFDTMKVIGTSAIAIHPFNQNTIYVGSGDRDAWDSDGAGIFVSYDGGGSWHPGGLNNMSNNFKVNKILINPLNPSTMFAATSSGVYRTTDAGNTWLNVYNMDVVKDLKFKPQDTTIIYGSGPAFIRSSDGGSNFLQITNGFPMDIGRLEFDVTKCNPNMVYAIISKSDASFDGIYASSDAGQTFSLRCGSPNILGYAEDGTDNSSQAWYDLAIAVAPNDSNMVFTGGVNVWKSVDGGHTFYVNTEWNTNSMIRYIHSDIHSLNFYGDTLYCGSDGGIFFTVDYGFNWSDISKGLGISQFYRMSGCESEPEKITAGAQDVGSNYFDGSKWTHLYGADGMETIINNTETYIMYISSQNGGIQRTIDGGNSFESVKPDGSNDGGWVTPYVMDANNPYTLWAGYEDIYVTYDTGDNWTKLSNNLIGNNTFDNLVVAPTNNNYIYATRDQVLYISSNGGQNWSPRIPSSGMTISGITVSNERPDRIWLTLTSSNADKVISMIGKQGPFVDITGNLTNMGFNCITFQKNSNNLLYIGTNIGVFYKDTTMTQWMPFNEDLPRVAVRELETNYALGKIRAATYGRGIWETSMYNYDLSTEYKLADEKIAIYPNPSQGIITIDLKEFKCNGTIDVFNISGVLVLQQPVLINKNSYQLDLKRLVAGSYYIRLTSGNKKVVKKVLLIP